MKRRAFLAGVGGFAASLTAGLTGLAVGTEATATKLRQAEELLAKIEGKAKPKSKVLYFSLFKPEEEETFLKPNIATINYGGDATVVRIQDRSNIKNTSPYDIEDMIRDDITKAIISHITRHGPLDVLGFGSHGTENRIQSGTTLFPVPILLHDLRRLQTQIQNGEIGGIKPQHSQPLSEFKLTQETIFTGCSIFNPDNNKVSELYASHADRLGPITAAETLVYSRIPNIPFSESHVPTAGKYKTVFPGGGIEPARIALKDTEALDRARNLETLVPLGGGLVVATVSAVGSLLLAHQVTEAGNTPDPAIPHKNTPQATKTSPSGSNHR